MYRKFWKKRVVAGETNFPPYMFTCLIIMQTFITCLTFKEFLKWSKDFSQLLSHQHPFLGGNITVVEACIFNNGKAAVFNYHFKRLLSNINHFLVLFQWHLDYLFCFGLSTMICLKSTQGTKITSFESSWKAVGRIESCLANASPQEKCVELICWLDKYVFERGRVGTFRCKKAVSLTT